MGKSIIEREADVEVLFEFVGTRKNYVANGYRPHHLIKENYLTTGIHHYYDVDTVSPSGTVKGTITFITPKEYPNCIWVGKKITIQEGAKIVGYATVLKVLNPILMSKCDL